MTSVRRSVGRHVAALGAMAIALGFIGLSGPGRRVEKPARPRVVLPEHEVRVVEFSPDSRLMVTDGDSGGVHEGRRHGSRTGRADEGGAGHAGAGEGHHLAPIHRRRPASGRPARGAEVRRRADRQPRGLRGGDGSGMRLVRGGRLGDLVGLVARPGGSTALFSDDGSTLAFCRVPRNRLGGRATAWDIDAEKAVAEFTGGPPLALAPDGSTLAHHDPRTREFPHMRAPATPSPPTILREASAPLRGPRPGSRRGDRAGRRGRSRSRPTASSAAQGFAGDQDRGFAGIEVREVSSGRVVAVLHPNPAVHSSWLTPDALRFGPDLRGPWSWRTWAASPTPRESRSGTSPVHRRAWGPEGSETASPRTAPGGPRPDGMSARVGNQRPETTAWWRRSTRSRPGPRSGSSRPGSIRCPSPRAGGSWRWRPTGRKGPSRPGSETARKPHPLRRRPGIVGTWL